MEPLTAVLGIAFVFIGLASWIAFSEQRAFLGPRSTRSIRASAEKFCIRDCRLETGCPLNSNEPAADCPLFKYIAADLPV